MIHISNFVMIMRWVTISLTIIKREIDQLEKPSPIYFVGTNWQLILGTHVTRCTWEFFHCFGLCLHNDNNEIVWCEKNVYSFQAVVYPIINTK